MKYKVKAKHDKGIVTLFFFADSEEQARELFLRNENAPVSAIVKIEKVPYYVTMTDKFMSGWGDARKINKFIVECDTFAQAETIQRNAEKRPEMKYINICMKKPRYGEDYKESWRTFEELGEIWTKN